MKILFETIARKYTNRVKKFEEEQGFLGRVEK